METEFILPYAIAGTDKMGELELNPASLVFNENNFVDFYTIEIDKKGRPQSDTLVIRLSPSDMSLIISAYVRHCKVNNTEGK